MNWQTMKIVLIGDIGWADFYHLGDEAMTDAALAELVARDICNITVIAGDPTYAAKEKGFPAVKRFGYRMGSRGFNAKRMASIMSHASGESSLPDDDQAIKTITAVREADAVLIAGGGNLNSTFDHHVYDRLTLVKLARFYGKPYALTSQTIGPLIYDFDQPLFQDLLSDQVFFTAREKSTLTLAKEFSTHPDSVIIQMDDAFALKPRPSDYESIADLNHGVPVDGNYIVASFAEKASSPILSDNEYHKFNAQICREIAEASGATVLLVPHAGALQEDDSKRDEITNQKLVELAGDDRVQATRMVTSRELVALTESARLVIGSRYHAGIIAAGAGVPHIALAPNLYSSVRMRGAAANVAFNEFVLPVQATEDIVKTATGLLSDSSQAQSIHTAIKRYAQDQLANHALYWDNAVAALRGESVNLGQFEIRPATDPIPNPFIDSYQIHSQYLDTVELYEDLISQRRAKQEIEVNKLKNSIKRLESDSTKLKTEVNNLKKELAEAKKPQPTQLSKIRKLARKVKRKIKR